jgi:hypothetical protein
MDAEHLLQQLVDEVRLLRLDLAEQRSAGDVRLGLLLRATQAALGGDTFTAGQLVELAGARLSTRIALQAAIEAVVGKAKAPSKSLGHFLRNHAGAGVDGLRLQRVRGSVYRVSMIETAESRRLDTWPS